MNIDEENSVAETFMAAVKLCGPYLYTGECHVIDGTDNKYRLLRKLARSGTLLSCGKWVKIMPSEKRV